MNEYRYMRTLLFFDLPIETKAQRKAYRNFVKKIKAQGFFMIQKSVYTKLSIDAQAADSSIKIIRNSLPNEGIVSVLTVTEKQFASMEYLLGEYKTDVLESDERIVEL